MTRLTSGLTSKINSINERVNALAESTEKNIAGLKTIFNTNLKSLNEFKLKNFKQEESTYYFVVYQNNEFKVNENRNSGTQIPNVEETQKYKTEMAKKEEDKNVFQKEKQIISEIIKEVSNKIRESMKKTFNEALEQVKILEELITRLEGLDSQELTDLLKDNGQDLTNWEKKDVSEKIEIIKNALTSKNEIIRGLIDKITSVNDSLKSIMSTVDSIDDMLDGKASRKVV